MPDVDEDELAAELEALGDEIATDTDTSYLDEAVIPPTPDKEPQQPQPQKNKVLMSFKKFNYYFKSLFPNILGGLSWAVMEMVYAKL